MDQNDILERDPLTGLYRREAFFAEVRKLLEQDADTAYVILRWDIERFKLINDLFGIRMGDTILKEIAESLKQSIRGNGIAGRLESDHFVMCIPEKSLDMEAMMQQVRQTIQEIGLDYEIVVYAGIYTIEERELPVEIMCDRAGLALHSTKGNYQERYAFYDDALREELLLEQMIAGEMKAALEGEQFQVYMQPQFNYATGEIIGAEALVRWNHPVRGMIRPDQFIPIFEKNGFISKLDEYVWEKTCGYISKWLNASDKVIPIAVAVNISRLDIYNPKLCDTLQSLIAQYNIPASMLKLEITESAYVEYPKQLIEVVKQLQSLGFIVEMDDFGSGYSSLNTLKDVPVDVLKLDLKFLADEDDSGRGGNILSSVVRMAEWLNLPVIAEGVETKKQADYLKSIGCYHMQGYYFAKPMTTDELEKLLESSAIGEVQAFQHDSDLINENEFWNPEAQMTLIFNSYVGGAGIFEYYKGNLESLRINDKYLDVMQLTRTQHDQYRLHVLELIVPDDRPDYIQMLSQAIETGNESECEVRFVDQANRNKHIWIWTRVRVIARNNERFMFYVAVENTTVDKERQLEHSSEQFASVIGALPVGIGIFELQGQTVVPKFFSDQICAILGMTKNEFIESVKDSAYVSSVLEIQEEDLIRLFHEKQNGDTGELVRRFEKHSGEIIWIRVVYNFFAKGNVMPLCYVTIYDVTESIKHERKQRWQDERYRILAERTNAITFDYDLEQDVLTYSSNLESSDYQDREFKNYMKENSMNAVYIHQDSQAVFLEAYRKACISPVKGSMDILIKRGEADYRWGRMYYASVADESGRVYRIVGRVDDIQEEKEKEEELRLKAEYDLGTGLYNKAATEALINRALSDAENRASYALFILDIDDFKRINDRMGHLFGDSFLKLVGDEMRRLFRGSDITGRIGGDEFVVLLHNFISYAVLKRKAEQLLDAFRQIKVPEVGNIRCSIGIAAADETTAAYGELLRRADKALYEAKHQGKNCFVIYDQKKSGEKHYFECEIVGRSAPPEKDERINNRVRMEQTLLQHVFQRLYEAKDTEQVIQSLLEVVGRHFCVSRAYIFEDSEDGTYCSNTFEWCNEGVQAGKEKLQQFHYEGQDGDYKKNFNSEGVFYCRDIRDLPASQYAVLEPQGVKAILQCVISENGKFKGYVGFDQCDANRFWTQAQIDTLTFISEILSTFLLKKRAQDRMEEAYVSLQCVLEQQSAAVYIVDPDTYDIVYANQKARDMIEELQVKAPCYQAIFRATEPCSFCPVEKIRATEQSCNDEIYNGRLGLWFSCDAVPIKWNRCDMIMVSSVDITKYKQTGK